MLRDGKVTIIGTRCDMGIDTESAYRHCVAAELGMKYEDVLIQEQRSDNSAYSLAQPAGSSGTVNAMPQLVLAARELKQKILERAAMPMPGFMMIRAEHPSHASRRSRKISISGQHGFRKSQSGQEKAVSARWPADS